MRFLRTVNTFVARIEEGLLVFIVLLMVMLAFAQVVMRNLLDQGFLWGDPFLRQLVLWVGFIGASLATRENKHINIDILSRLMKGKAKNIINILVHLIAALISFILCRAAWQFVADERMFGTVAFNDIPAWYFQIIIPIGFALMALRFLIHAVEESVAVTKPNGKSE